MPETRNASCSCGQLSVTCSGEPDSIVQCHCLDCQKRTGSAFGLGVYYDKNQLAFSGTARAYASETDAGNQLVRHFCPNCGTSLYWYSTRDEARIGVAVGAFGDPQFPKPVRAVYGRSRHHWLAACGIPTMESHRRSQRID